MKNDYTSWIGKISAAKEAAKAAGLIAGDIDISTIVSEKIKAAGLKPVDRGAVNHWLKGRRQPNVTQFVALCEALRVSPAEVLSSTDKTVVQFRAKEQNPPRYLDLDDEDLLAIEQINRATPENRKLALAAALGVLKKSSDSQEKKTTKQQK
jgi:DNA-binding transcriptional regulator YdaS (Cro superfamily)